jgi:hypothetical protein
MQIVITGIQSKTNTPYIIVYGVTVDTFEKVSFKTDISEQNRLQNVMQTATPIDLNLNTT